MHTAHSVIRTARLQHVFLVPIPPASTALVQPLDVHTFAQYKRFLEDQFREHRMVRTGPVSVHEWFKFLFRACAWLRSESWHIVFSLPGCPIWAWSCTVILPSFFLVGASRSVSQNACHQQSWGCSYLQGTSLSTRTGSEHQSASCHCSIDSSTQTCRPLLACKSRCTCWVLVAQHSNRESSKPEPHSSTALGF